MGLHKGQCNNPAGRPVGAKNKKSVLMNDFANYIIENGMEKFIKELNKLNGKGYVDSFLTVYEYVKSKLARVEHAGNTGITIINIKGDAIPSQLASLEGDNQRQLRSVDGE